MSKERSDIEELDLTDIDPDLLLQIVAVASKRGWELKTTFQKLLAAGLAAEAASFSGLDVVGYHGDEKTIILEAKK